jgi:hypothetical protein
MNNKTETQRWKKDAQDCLKEAERAFSENSHRSATHVRIVSPEALDSDPVDAVIVMAASYSDEVARIIRQKFDRNINISILRDFGLEVV